MKTSSIVVIIVGVTLGLVLMIAWNALRVKREFVVLYNDELKFCFLVDEGTQYDIGRESFSYWGGKNKGHMQLMKGEISKDFVKVMLNGFQTGYKKIKNKRIYEYSLGQSVKLRDVFVNRENMPVNLVPYRESCTKIKSNFKNHIKIFHGE